jgi:hypothetical protein
METEITRESTHPDLPAEQAYLDRAYECLEDMRQQAARGARIVVAGDPYAEEAIYQMACSALESIPSPPGTLAGTSFSSVEGGGSG